MLQRSPARLPSVNQARQARTPCKVRIMNETDLCFLPATAMADAIRTKKLSAVEITTALLDRIGRLEPKLNAFAYLAADEAMEAARAADSGLAKGDPIGPLHGVPVTIKDHEPVRGMQIEFGTWLRRGETAAADGVMAGRPRPGGALLPGKTAAPEVGGAGGGNNPRRRRTHQPWERSRNA